MYPLDDTFKAPEIQAERWLNSPPLTLARELRGKVVLLDFWDYTCVNCLHALPYLRVWQARYFGSDLVIIGVHTPEFAFGKDYEHVAKAVRALKLPYPIALDNDYRIWNAYGNRAWPSKFLIDAEGQLRGYQFGEGRYPQTEAFIQQLLHEIHPDREFPEPLAPRQPIDDETRACYPVTPELHLGHQQGRLNPPQTLQPGQTAQYQLPTQYRPDGVYLGGRWHSEAQFVEARQPEAALSVVYNARAVNVVMAPPEGQSARVRVLQNMEPLPTDCQGRDVQPGGIVELKTPRMYEVVTNPHMTTAHLRLLCDPGVRVYALTFVTECRPDSN